MLQSPDEKKTKMAIAIALIRIGELLESLEEPLDAALIYEEVTNSYGSTTEICSQVHHFAGLAF